MKTIFFDTETTGLTAQDEILEIAICDDKKNVLMHTYVKPERHQTWEDAEAINHISPEIVKFKPTITQLKPRINQIFQNADLVVAYNVDYDMKYIRPLLVREPKTACAMKAFAEYFQEPNLQHPERGKWRWKNLSFAMNHFGLEWNGQAHGALADTYACCDVWNTLKSKQNTISAKKVLLDSEESAESSINQRR